MIPNHVACLFDRRSSWTVLFNIIFHLVCPVCLSVRIINLQIPLKVPINRRMPCNVSYQSLPNCFQVHTPPASAFSGQRTHPQLANFRFSLPSLIFCLEGENITLNSKTVFNSIGSLAYNKSRIFLIENFIRDDILSALTDYKIRLIGLNGRIHLEFEILTAFMALVLINPHILKSLLLK